MKDIKYYLLVISKTTDTTLIEATNARLLFQWRVYRLGYKIAISIEKQELYNDIFNNTGIRPITSVNTQIVNHYYIYHNPPTGQGRLRKRTPSRNRYNNNRQRSTSRTSFQTQRGGKWY